MTICEYCEGTWGAHHSWCSRPENYDEIQRSRARLPGLELAHMMVYNMAYLLKKDLPMTPERLARISAFEDAAHNIKGEIDRTRAHKAEEPASGETGPDR